MRKSIVKKKLKAGELILVNKICFYNPDLVELISMLGFDCLWICNEHLSFDSSMLSGMIRAARAGGMDCLVRTGQTSQDDYVRFLEMGAYGLMIPHVKDAEKARRIIELMKFPPIGKRGIDGVSADACYGLMGLDNYLRHANENSFNVIQIETTDALDNVEEIAAVEGVDVVFVGPNDLSLNMGIPGQFKDKKVIKALERVVKACENTNAVCGTPSLDAEHCKLLQDIGIKFFTGTSDYRILANGFKQFKEQYQDLGFVFRDVI